MHRPRKTARTRRLGVEALETRRVLATWHNAALPTDVDGSGTTESFDAILVINELILRDFSDPASGALGDECPGDLFLDVTGQGPASVEALDALLVINRLPVAEVPPNTFTIAENVPDGTVVGRIEPSGGVNADSRFEFVKNSAVPDDIRQVLELQPDDHYDGAADATVVLIEYVDFACPICGLYRPLTQNALGQFGDDIAIVTRHLPLTSIHPNAEAAAIAAEAAGRQGMFDEYADLLFRQRTITNWDDLQVPTFQFRAFAQQLGLDLVQFTADLEDPALRDRVRRDATAAVNTLGFQGTPSFVLNDFQVQLPGASQPQVNRMFQTAIAQVDSPFRVDRFTGEIRVEDTSLLDFETQRRVTFDVMVNGNVETVTVNLTDVVGS